MDQERLLELIRKNRAESVCSSAESSGRPIWESQLDELNAGRPSRWDQLSRKDRVHIVNAVAEMEIAMKIASELWATFPEAQWRMALYPPIFYFVDNPLEYVACVGLKPSEIALKALATLMGAGEATIKRWAQGKGKPRAKK